jgi:ribosomal protein L7/L12
MMAIRRTFSLAAKLQEVGQLKGSQYQSAMTELYNAHQLNFDSQQRQARLQTELSEERKEVLSLLVEHLLHMSQSEVKVLVHKLRPQGQINWNVFRRKAQFTAPPPDEGPLKSLGMSGYPADILGKILSGELFEGLTPVEAQVEEVVQEPAKVEKTTFNIVLKGFDPATKVKLIKEVKDQLALGLKESKDKVEEALAGPVVLFKSIPKEQAEERLAKLKAVGAVVEIE